MKTLLRFYLVALAGILIHISFDVITSYGTRLLLPFSETRFALDWMFIVDPFFTIPLGVMLALGRLARKRRKLLVLCAAIFVAVYLATEMVCSRMAHARTQQALASSGIKPVKISVLPQPLSVFRWKALAQTEAAIYQAFFSVWEEEPLHFEKFENASDAYVARAIATKELQWYLTFARHPWIRSTTHGEYHIVELTDLQFTFDQALLNTLGASERPMPFIMRFVFSREGELLHSDFNESSFARLGDSAVAR
ncbi:metal-dependent hydrolase [candidate division KSB1 bacterium]|nr:metal-dependent hydrolase [candidate division KSB1 bacterium]